GMIKWRIFFMWRTTNKHTHALIKPHHIGNREHKFPTRFKRWANFIHDGFRGVWEMFKTFKRRNHVISTSAKWRLIKIALDHFNSSIFKWRDKRRIKIKIKDGHIHAKVF